MNEIAMGNLLALFSIIMIIVNYVFTALTMFKVSKKEETSKAFFAWIPILNDYLLIKLGHGAIGFFGLALASLILGNPMMTDYLNSNIVGKLGTAVTVLWTVYKIILYNRICDRYNASVIIIAAGFLMQFISKLSIAGIVVSVVGQIILMIKVNNNIAPKTIIESKIVLSKLHRKEEK
ncbi:MAG: hypothetical protein E7213_04760 [Clostridium sp.]|nr:hypothetical protein [Clostridium sp.]